MALNCSGDGDHGPPKNRVGLSFGAFRSRLYLSNFGQIPLEEAAVGASYERRVSNQITLQVNAGGIAYGKILEEGRSFRGFFVGGAVSWLVLNQKGAIPFVMLGLSLSFSLAPLIGTPDRFYAGDVRGSVTSGYTLGGRFTPYAVARLFGGPVVVTTPGLTSIGTDIYHFQLGAGLVVALPKGFDVSVELIPLGEQRVSAGVGYSF